MTSPLDIFSYAGSVDAGQKLFRFDAPSGISVTIKIYKLTDNSAAIHFIDDNQELAPWPEDAFVVSNGQLHPPFGDVVCIYWAESYMLMIDGLSMMTMNTQRQQAIQLGPYGSLLREPL